MKPVDAIYENGQLRPAKPLGLDPGERVRIIVCRKADPSRWDHARLGHPPPQDEGALTETGLAEWADALDAEDRA